jgi:tripartite-type tricarboxylate transporter receptor subunit TctC
VLGLVSGQIDLILVSTASAISQIRAGKIKALAVSGENRLASVPDVPTFAEAGVPGFSVMNWSGLAFPSGTPGDLVARVHSEVRKALETQDMKDFIAGMSAEPGGVEPSAFTALVKEETARWAAVAEKAGVEKQ